MIDIYEGTLGTLFNASDIIRKLTEYMAKSDSNLAYEVVCRKTKFIIITGKNDMERDLPTWTHPLIFKDIRHEDVVAIDLRPYMKSNLSDMITVREKMQDRYNGMLQLYRGILTKKILDNDMEWLYVIRPMASASFSSIFSTITSMLTYDNNSKDIVAMVAKLHYATMLEERPITDIRDALSRLTKKDASLIMYNYKPLASILSESLGDTFILPSRTLNRVIENTKLVLPATRGNGLNVDIYIQTLSRGFFSLDSKYLAIGFVEHLPTMLTIIYMVNKEGINSKSSFRKIINNNKRETKPAEYNNLFEDIISWELVD